MSFIKIAMPRMNISIMNKSSDTLVLNPLQKKDYQDYYPAPMPLDAGQAATYYQAFYENAHDLSQEARLKVEKHQPLGDEQETPLLPTKYGFHALDASEKHNLEKILLQNPSEEKKTEENAVSSQDFPPKSQEEQEAITAQKVLILAYLKEEQYAEIASLENFIDEKNSSLKDIFHSRSVEEQRIKTQKTSPTKLHYQSTPYSEYLPTWQQVLQASLSFLPENCLLVINDDIMKNDIEACPSCDAPKNFPESSKDENEILKHCALRDIMPAYASSSRVLSFLFKG